MWHDLRYAVRALSHSPGFTIAVVLTLTLGIGANTVIFSIIKAVFLTPLPYPEPDRLVMVWQRDSRKGLSQERVTPANFSDWQEQNQVFEHIGFYPAWGGAQSFRLAGEAGAERVAGAYVSSGLFRALGVEAALGRTFVRDEDTRGGNQAAVLSDSLWRRRFGGDGQILGRPITIDTYGLRTYTIVGVMPPGFNFPDGSEIWLPAGWMGVTVPPPGAAERCCSWLEVVARLKAETGAAQAETQMNALARSILESHPEPRDSAEVAVIPLLDQMTGPVKRPLLILQGAVLFVLLIGAANVAGLMLSRAFARRHDIVMHAILGAGRARLVRQSMIESLLLALVSAFLGSLLAFFSHGAVIAAGGGRIPRLDESKIDPAILGFAVLLSVLVTLLFGLAPALTASRTAVGGRQWTPRDSPVRNLLVVSEMALATMLLVGAGLLIESFFRLRHVDPGFRPENLVTARFDMTARAFSDRIRPRVFFQDLMTRIRSLPGVSWAGGASMLPLADSSAPGQPITIESRGILPAADSATAKTGGATPDYFRAMGVPLLRGRFFTESDGPNSPIVVIINETMARRYWPNENPIGQRVVLGSRERLSRVRQGSEPAWMEIVGVVADMRGRGLEVEPRPELYLPYWQWPWYEVDIVVRTSGDTTSLAAAIPRISQDLDRNALITRVRTMDEIVGESVAQPRFRASLLGAFAGAALLLAALGIYSVVSLSVTQRTREIGIRMALGARRAVVLRMFLFQTLKLSTAGVVIGLAGSLAVSGILSSLLFEVGPNDPATLLYVSLVLTGIAAVAGFAPARRATRIDPMTALRCE